MKYNKSLLHITPSSFVLANNLKRVIVTEIINSKLNLNLDGKINVKDPLQSDISGETIGSLIQSALQVAVSEDVEKAIFECAKSALYDKNKIDYDFFEPIETRPLYYPIMLELAKVNMQPFIEGLSSQFGGLTKILKNIQK